MKEIDMGGFENQEVTLKFAGKEYIIQVDPPIELYRQFLSLVGMKLEKEKDWNKVKKFIAELVGFYNDINQKKFKESLTKSAVTNFLVAYGEIIRGIAGDKKKVTKKNQTSK